MIFFFILYIVYELNVYNVGSYGDMLLHIYVQYDLWGLVISGVLLRLYGMGLWPNDLILGG